MTDDELLTSATVAGPMRFSIPAPLPTPKTTYYVVKSEGVFGESGTALTLVGRYRPWLIAAANSAGWIIGEILFHLLHRA